jgi:hypothetical protein
VEAAKAFKIPKQRNSFSKAAAAAIRVPPAMGEGFALLSPETNQPVFDYEVDTRRAVIGRAAINRSRPKVVDWAVEAEFALDTDALPLSVFAEVVGYAGSRVGILDYRPEKTGQFGCFTVAKLDVVV